MPLVSEECEEEGMPPPPDNDSRGPIYTFSSGMTPLSFSSNMAPIAPTQDNSPQPSFPSPFISESLNLDDNSGPSTSMTTPSLSRTHGKRRDPSYIPRPPNAFILFRCAFIKEQNIPGNVEGNHSKLSKIIGLCWKQLPPEEKEKWEAKAVVAQADHRAHYPDWRFRPGANAMAKQKVKESMPASRRRSVRSKASKDNEDPAEKDVVTGSDTKAKGKMKATAHDISLEEKRCAKIAGFVAEGIKGEELEEAVKQWEGDHIIPKPTTKAPTTTRSKTRKPKVAPTHSRTHSTASITLSFPAAPPISEAHLSTPVSMQDGTFHTDSTATVQPPPQGNRNANTIIPPVLSGMPLTHMFKRATSAPATDSRVSQHSPASEPSDSSADDLPSSAEDSPVVGRSFDPSVLQHGAPSPTRTHNNMLPHTHGRRDTVSFPLSTITESHSMGFASPQQMTWQEAESQRRYEEAQQHDAWAWQPESEKSDPFGFSQQMGGQDELSTQGMSYEIPHGGSQFDRGYLEQYGTYGIIDKVDTGQPEWTNTANSGRQGVTIAIEDPYEDDCAPSLSLDHNVPSAATPMPLSPNSSYYYTQMSPQKPTQYTSNFSSLRDWAGEQQTFDQSPVWPNSVPQSPLSGSPWYSNTDTLAPWGSQPPPLLHQTVAHDADDWDRLEYRNSSSFNLPVEPMRQVNFHDELLAQQRQNMS